MAKIAMTSNRGLSFGALLTKIFRHFRVDFTNEDTQNLTPAITDYFIGRADIFTVHPTSQPQPSAGPSTSQPQPSTEEPPASASISSTLPVWAEF